MQTTVTSAKRCWLPERGILFVKPGRKVPRSRYSITGRVATKKLARSQDSESALEHSFFNILEHDWRVERFASQAITLRWNDAAGYHEYTPDVAVRYTDDAVRADPALRTTLFEVKPIEILQRDWPELKPKFRAAIGWARYRDFRFHILTEREIYTPYFDNVHFLLKFQDKNMQAQLGATGEIRRRIRETLYRLKRSTPRELLKAITPVERIQAGYIPWIWFLVNSRRIGCDLRAPLTMASKIWSLETAATLAEDP